MQTSRILQPTLLLLGLSTAALACHEEPTNQTDETETGDPGETDTAGDGDGDVQASTRYWQDVAPIYYESCVSCHRDDGIAPFALDNYESAAAWATVSAMAIEQGDMPPFLVETDGSCNDWQHAPTLTPEQLDTIWAWIDDGTPEGTPRDDLQVPEQPGLADARSFMTPEFIPMPEGGVLSQNDEYRCFLIDPQLDHDVFMTGYHVTPGNDALVHHVLAMPVDPNLDVGDGLTNLDVIQALDAESPDRLGWPCFGAAGDNVSVKGFPVTWAPGQGAVELPANSGSRLAAGDLLVVQIHYNMVDTSLIGQSDRSRVDLRLVDEVAHEGLFDVGTGLISTLFEGNPHIIPAGEPAHEFTWRLPADWYIGWLGSEQLELWGFFPHMHEYGIKLEARLLDDQGQEVGCVGDVPRWDFGWQLYYFMQQPMILKPGYEIEVTCTYDTTTAPTDIWPGWGTFNEMCLMGVYLVAP